MAARTKSAPGLGLLVAVLGVLVSIGMNGCDCPACPGSWQCKVRLTDVSEEVEYFFRFEVYYSGENRAALPPLASGSFIVVYQPMDPDQN